MFSEAATERFKYIANTAFCQVAASGEAGLVAVLVPMCNRLSYTLLTLLFARLSAYGE